MEATAPGWLADEGDPVGLQVGEPDASVQHVLVALDVSDAVVEEALATGADLVVSHHPLVVEPLRGVTAAEPIGRAVLRLVRAGVGVFVAHTNLDRAPGGVNDALAETLGLKDTTALVPSESEGAYKLVVFAPAADVGRLIQAMGDAGGGLIGKYSHCSFRAAGTGTFRPLEGASPVIGEIGRLNEVEEYRVEMLVPADLRAAVVRAMLAEHPYEEVAYELYRLAPRPVDAGMGRIGKLAGALKLSECVRMWGDLLGSKPRVAGNPDSVVANVAVCGGSGARLIERAAAAAVDVFLTGDVKYHDAQRARRLGLAVVDAGHRETERPVLPILRMAIEERLSERGLEAQVSLSQTGTGGWNEG